MGRREDRPSNEQQAKEALQLGFGVAEIVHGAHTLNPGEVADGWNRVNGAAGSDSRAGKARSSRSSR
jgi:hypothetical protein